MHAASARREFEAMQARKAHGGAWAKKDAWKDIKGGFNPEVFKDLDSGTRQRLLDYQVGPPKMVGDKGLGVLDMFGSVGHWSDGGGYGAILPYGLDKLRPEAGHGTNRGNVQNAAWESGFANIGNKDQLNQFLDRADAVKAKHGDFLKDGWTPEAQMLMRNYEPLQQAPSLSASTQEPIKAPARPTAPAVDSDHLADAKERAQAFQNGFGNSTPFSSYGGQNTGEHRIAEANQTLNQSNNFQIYGNTSNV